jgi:hypothetical protein
MSTVHGSFALAAFDHEAALATTEKSPLTSSTLPEKRLTNRPVHSCASNADAELAATMGLDRLLARFGAYELVDHWTQGEFHHDVVLRVHGDVLVVATNCNGGVKEVLLFDELPDRWALWSDRCPDNADFRARTTQTLRPPRARACTPHWFDPCELLGGDARSELKPSCRRRAVGGGWEPDV